SARGELARAGESRVRRAREDLGEVRVLQDGDGALGSALRAGDAAAQLGGLLPRGIEEGRRADEGLLRHEARILPREALADGGLGELLDHQENVRRPGTGDRRECVDLRLGYLD